MPLKIKTFVGKTRIEFFYKNVKIKQVTWLYKKNINVDMQGTASITEFSILYCKKY